MNRLLSRREIAVEVTVVLGLSLGASAVYSLLSLLGKLTQPGGLAASTTTINPSRSDREWLDAAYQYVGIALGLAPVALVLYLLWRELGTRTWATVGLDRATKPVGASPIKPVGGRPTKPAPALPQQILRGLALAAAIGLPGIGLYLLARQLGWASKVMPSGLDPAWWALIALVLAAAKAALLEEIIVVGYLFHRLRQLGLQPWAIVAAAALLRASYHLYQGFGGFIGNLAMGVVFGLVYLRLRRRPGALWPLIIAHFALDAAVFLGGSLVDLSAVL